MNLQIFARLCVAGLVGLTMVSGASADQTPSALRGNSIVLSWSDLITWKDRDDNVRNKSHVITVKVYVSSQNRIFSSYDYRHIRRHGSGGSITEEVSGADETKLHWKFEGGALIADQNFGNHGARRVIVSFSDDFKQCSIDVKVAKEAGSGHIRMRGLNLDQVTITGETCGVQSGNVFDNPDSNL